MSNEKITLGTPCRVCRQPMVPCGEPVVPGYREHCGRGLCIADYASVLRSKRLEDFPRVRVPAVGREAFTVAHRALESAGASISEMATALGMTENTVRIRRSRYGLSKKQSRPREPRSQLSNEELARLRKAVGLA